MKNLQPYLAISVVTLALGSPAHAQAEAQKQAEDQAADDAIIVTAQRRAERPQDVPISITSISA